MMQFYIAVLIIFYDYTARQLNYYDDSAERTQF